MSSGRVGTPGIGVANQLAETTPSNATMPTAGVQTLFIDSADHILKRKDNAGVVTPVEGRPKDPRWNLLSGQTSIDEFNDSSIDAAWVQVDGANAPASSVTWLEDADTLSVQEINVADTGNAFHAKARPISAMATGDALITCITLFGKAQANYIIGGLGVADGVAYGSGKQVVAETYSQAADTVQTNSFSGFTNYTTSSGGALAVVDFSTAFSVPIYIRLVYLGSGVYRSDRSANGVQWIKGQTITMTSFTPTHVLFTTRKPTSGTEHICSFDFLRRVSGIT